MGIWEMERCFELSLIFASTNLVGGSPSTDQQRNRIDEERFTSPSLPGQDNKPRLELETELLNEREIDDAQLGEHCGGWLHS